MRPTRLCLFARGLLPLVVVAVGCTGRRDRGRDDDDPPSPDAADDDASTDDGGAQEPPCTGNLIDLIIQGEPMRMRVAASPFLDGAHARVGTGGHALSISWLQLGSPCDPRWSWSVDGSFYSGNFGEDGWVDPSTASPDCDVPPSFIEADVQGWFASYTRWCPTEVAVLAVTES